MFFSIILVDKIPYAFLHEQFFYRMWVAEFNDISTTFLVEVDNIIQINSVSLLTYFKQ